jgi:hypothetical protein
LLLAVAELAGGTPSRARGIATATITETDAIESVASACAVRLIWCSAQRALGAADDLAFRTD